MYIGKLRVRIQKDRHWAWGDIAAYVAVHALCLCALFYMPSGFDLLLGLTTALIVSFGVSVGWHRYLSHRAFETGRSVQFALVFCGVLGGMKGPLWFAQFHGLHHRAADQQEDVHSPWAKGVFYSHSGWFLNRANRFTDYGAVRRWAAFPELVWLNNHCQHVALATGIVILACFGVSSVLWGYVVPVVLVWHGFKSIGSFCHGIGGYRRFATPDHSCNQPLVSVFTFGEGWHNNHHFAPYSARLGHSWWELDPGWLAIWLMEKLGLVWNVRRPRGSAAGAPGSGAQHHLERFVGHLRALEPVVTDWLDTRRNGDARAVRQSVARSFSQFADRAAAAFRNKPTALPGLLEQFLADMQRATAVGTRESRSLRRLVYETLSEGRFYHLWQRPLAGGQHVRSDVPKVIEAP